MTRDDAVALLQIRWRLTGQRFDTDTPDAWAEALEGTTLLQARRHMIELCRESGRVALPDLWAKVRPAHRPYDEDVTARPWPEWMEEHRHGDPNDRGGLPSEHVPRALAATHEHWRSGKRSVRVTLAEWRAWQRHGLVPADEPLPAP